MDMDEIWKECRSLPGYKVSNLGRVKGPKGIENYVDRTNAVI